MYGAPGVDMKTVSGATCEGMTEPKNEGMLDRCIFELSLEIMFKLCLVVCFVAAKCR